MRFVASTNFLLAFNSSHGTEQSSCKTDALLTSFAPGFPGSVDGDLHALGVDGDLRGTRADGDRQVEALA